MAQANIELIGCASYSWGRYTFKRNVPQTIHDEKAIAYFTAQDGFSIRKIVNVNPVAKKVEPIPEKAVEVEPVENVFEEKIDEKTGEIPSPQTVFKKKKKKKKITGK